MKIRLLAGLLLFAAVAAALDPRSLKPAGYVTDFSGVLDATARLDIERYCGAVEKATGAQIAIVTLPTLEGESVEYFANELFRAWGIGKKGEDNGVLLLLVTSERHSRLEVGRGLEPVITDGTAGSLLRQMRPALQKGDYASALGTAVRSLGERIAASKGVTIDQTYAPRRQVEQEPDSIPWPFVVVVVFILLVMFMGRGRRGGGGGFLPGMILGNMMGRSSYGGYGRGGFGGYDSGGGGFSGFGGGDSGGGGASSNW